VKYGYGERERARSVREKNDDNSIKSFVLSAPCSTHSMLDYCSLASLRDSARVSERKSIVGTSAELCASERERES
jgi:hypothetical protein